jgi:hypothetical protein
MSDVYEGIKTHFSGDEDVTVLSGRGAQGIKLGKKLVVMFMKGDLMVKLPERRVSEIIVSGEGESFDPGTGKPMKSWVLIPKTRKDLWIKYGEEAKKSASIK